MTLELTKAFLCYSEVSKRSVTLDEAKHKGILRKKKKRDLILLKLEAASRPTPVFHLSVTEDRNSEHIFHSAETPVWREINT